MIIWHSYFVNSVFYIIIRKKYLNATERRIMCNLEGIHALYNWVIFLCHVAVDVVDTCMRGKYERQWKKRRRILQAKLIHWEETFYMEIKAVSTISTRLKCETWYSCYPYPRRDSLICYGLWRRVCPNFNP
jgi:hypothetical protein